MIFLEYYPVFAAEIRLVFNETKVIRRGSRLEKSGGVVRVLFVGIEGD